MSVAGEFITAADYALAFRLLEPVPDQPRRPPRAPRSVGGDMFGWFRVTFTDDGPQIVAEEAEESRLKLTEFIGQLQRHHHVDAAQTVIAGFSQGGILTASAALTAPGSVAGFAVLCGRIVPELEPSLRPRGALSALDALIVHGRRDDKLPVAWAERAVAWLQRLGMPRALRLHYAGMS